METTLPGWGLEIPSREESMATANSAMKWCSILASMHHPGQSYEIKLFLSNREKHYLYLLKLRNLCLKRKYLFYTKVDLTKVCRQVNAVLF